MARNSVHGHFHKKLAEEIDRLLLDCEKMGIFLTKTDATALIAEKSRRGFMQKADIIEYVRQLKRVPR